MYRKRIVSKFMVFIMVILTCTDHAYGTSHGTAQTPTKPYDIWSYTSSMEEGKMYAGLSVLLESFLEQRSLEKHEKKIYDPEGVAYILDDLAGLYTTGLINFQKAIEFNEKALQAYMRLISCGLDNIPVSGYYNKRRKYYYYIYFSTNSEDSAGSTSNTEKSQTYGNVKTATFFSKVILESVRQDDLKRLKNRIDNRRKYLNQRIGLVSTDSEYGIVAREGDISETEDYIEQTGIYNTYYKNFYLVDKLWRSRKFENKDYYSKIENLCREAIELQAEQRHKDDLDSYNRLRYWLGQSCIISGNLKDGIHYVGEFFNGLEEIDQREMATVLARKTMIHDISEEIRAKEERKMARKRALNIFYASTVGLLVTGTMATLSVISGDATFLLLGLQAGIGVAYSIKKPKSFYTADNWANLKNEEELKSLITPVSLKVGRYLDKFEQVELFQDLAMAYADLGKPKEASKYYKEALTIIEMQRSTISSEANRINFSAIKDDIYEDTVSIMLDSDQPEAAFEYVERAKSRAFLDILAGRTNMTLKTKEETTSFRDLMNNRNELSALMDQTSLSYDQLDNTIKKSNRAVEIAPTRTSRLEFDSLTDMKTITAKKALEMTKEDLSILEFFITDKILHIFLLDSGKLYTKSIPIEEKSIFRLISSLRKNISQHKENHDTTDNISRALYNILMEPVREMITKKRLCIIPHGWIHYIPFQALKGNNDRFVVEDYAITYSPSATIMKISLEKGRDKKLRSAIVMANSRQDLLFAEQEGEFVANKYWNSAIFTGNKATETVFKDIVSNYDIVHIANHAVFDSVDPLSSSVVLAPDDRNDGNLEVTDFYQLDLKASLVVMSACESGLAYISKGDELIGLIRGVMYAGASSVVSTLWKVDDRSTAYLMEQFYDNLNTMPKDIALQKAQLATIREYPAVFNWAPFILTGDCN